MVNPEKITNPQRSADEIARARIRTCETNSGEGHALSQFALDDLVLCRAFLAAREESETLRVRSARLSSLMEIAILDLENIQQAHPTDYTQLAIHSARINMENL